ncbi:MAG TPA: hypothetical protein VIU41_06980 [Geobacteraceae bacterium]
MKRFSCLVLLLLLTVVLPGCASISLVDSWKDPGVAAKQYRKVLVVGIADKMQMRHIFEEVFADEVRKRGIEAVPSYLLTGSDKLSRPILEAATIKSGADAVITTRVVNLKRNADVRTGFIMTEKGYTSASLGEPFIQPTDLFDYYGTTVAYAEFKHQSVEVTMSKVATVETNLFDGTTRKMVWSGTSSAVNPDGMITASSELAKVVIKAMSAAGLL